MITIRRATRQDAGSILIFQLRMAEETEDVLLAKLVVSKGIAALFDDPAKGIYHVAELKGKIIGITPGQYTTVKFFSGGSEATEASIKLARQYWMQAGHPRKYKVISRYRSYHGGTGHAMAASAQTAWKWKFGRENERMNVSDVKASLRGPI